MLNFSGIIKQIFLNNIRNNNIYVNDYKGEKNGYK